MQEIKCKRCGKLLMEAEGSATIIKICPKCKTKNIITIHPELSEEELQKVKNEWYNKCVCK